MGVGKPKYDTLWQGGEVLMVEPIPLHLQIPIPICHITIGIGKLYQYWYESSDMYPYRKDSHYPVTVLVLVNIDFIY